MQVSCVTHACGAELIQHACNQSRGVNGAGDFVGSIAAIAGVLLAFFYPR